MTSPIFLDLTELTANPWRTGIQRVQREIIRHWPGPRPLVPCRFDTEIRGFVSLPDAVMDILGSDVARPGKVESDLLAPHLAGARPITTGDLVSGLFNPEVFFDPLRAEAYRALCSQPAAEITWLIYDFLPYLRPEYFTSGSSLHCMHYILAMRDVPRTCFISDETRADYATRVIRDPRRAGPCLPLGGDGLQIERALFDPSKKLFAYIGTIEPRKNVAEILEGIEHVWRRGIDAEMVVVGRMNAGLTREPPILDRLKRERRFCYLGHGSDAAVRDVLQRARATLFVSSAEGFGIPPYESLAAGIPVIASNALPSLSLLPPGGRIILDAVTPETIAAAIEQIMDDQTAARLWNEAAQLKIPTWKQFAVNLADWLHQPVAAPVAMGP